MDWEAILKRVNPQTARAFVAAARNLIDALLIQAEAASPALPPESRDYTQAELPRQAPAGGWLSAEELRRAAQQMGEALAVEKWVEGVLAAVRVLSALRG